jgi:hypothetical protein
LLCPEDAEARAYQETKKELVGREASNRFCGAWELSPPAAPGALAEHGDASAAVKADMHDLAAHNPEVTGSNPVPATTKVLVRVPFDVMAKGT